MYDIAVIGLGLIGAAALRHLVDMGYHTVGIGPAEPVRLSDREHVFASHYDEGRITRVIDPLPFWALAGRRSLDAYAELEARSGIRFHGPVGCLRVSADPEAEDDSLHRSEANGRVLDAQYEILDGFSANSLFPFLHFEANARVLWEQGGAGYVNPRRMVSAQLISAVNGGGSVMRASVVAMQSNGEGVVLTTEAGEQIEARRALLTGGAWANMLSPKPLKLRPRAATMLMAALDEREAERLATMPSIIYRLKGHAELYSVYLLPPIRYPDGKCYVKIGGTFLCPQHFADIDATNAWFHTEGDLANGEALKAVLLDLIPGTAVESYHTVPCVVTYTEHEHPYIDRIASNVIIGVGGNGAAAKSSNEIGRIAALAIAHNEWVYDIEHTLFQAVYV